MLNRKGFAAVAACAAATLACAGLTRASIDDAPACCASDALTLSKPVMAADAAPRKPLMAELDQVGAASKMDEYGFNVYGWVEASWTYNFNTPPDHLNRGRTFDLEDSDITLNQVDLTVERAITTNGDKFDIGGKMEWMWGGDARFIHSNGLFDHYGFTDGPDEQFDLVQLYATFNVPVGEGILVTAGKFVTPFGYETISPVTNSLYSHSYLFGFAIPFTHTGITAKYQLNKDWSIYGGVVRGWDQALEDNNGNWMSYMAGAAYSKDQMDFYINFITGPEQTDNHSDYRSVIDGTVVYRFSDAMSFAVNADFGWESDAASDGSDAVWFGGAAYMTYKFDDHFTFQGRAEYFSDDDGARGIGTQVTELTAGLNVHPCPNNKWGSGLVIRPELRYDYSGDKVFNFDPSDGSADQSQITFGIDAIYAF